MKVHLLQVLILFGYKCEKERIETYVSLKKEDLLKKLKEIQISLKETEWLDSFNISGFEIETLKKVECLEPENEM